MSIGPESAPELTITAAPPRRSWHSKLLRICFAVFCFEIGLFLAVFPWLDIWNLNYLQDLSPSVEVLWDTAFFRGALTGLGLVNVYIAFLELFRLLRRS